MDSQPSHREIVDLLERTRSEWDAAFREVRAMLEENGRKAESAQRAIGVVAEALEKIEDKLGAEPNSDGVGGYGLIGDMRKTGRDLQSIMDLKNKGMGAVAAVTLFGALILSGIIYWLQRVLPAAKAKVAALSLAWGLGS